MLFKKQIQKQVKSKQDKIEWRLTRNWCDDIDDTKTLSFILNHF